MDGFIHTPAQVRPRLPVLHGTGMEVSKAFQIRRLALLCDLNRIECMPVPEADSMARLMGEPVEFAINLIQEAVSHASHWRQWLVSQDQASWWLNNSHGVNAMTWAALDEALCAWVPKFEFSPSRTKIADEARMAIARCEEQWGQLRITSEP